MVHFVLGGFDLGLLQRANCLILLKLLLIETQTYLSLLPLLHEFVPVLPESGQLTLKRDEGGFELYILLLVIYSFPQHSLLGHLVHILLHFLQPGLRLRVALHALTALLVFLLVHMVMMGVLLTHQLAPHLLYLLKVLLLLLLHRLQGLQLPLQLLELLVQLHHLTHVGSLNR